MQFLYKLNITIGNNKHFEKINRTTRMTKRPHWTTEQVLQQVLDTEDPAESEGEDYMEDPVAEADIGEVDRDEPVMDGSDDELSDLGRLRRG